MNLVPARAPTVAIPGRLTGALLPVLLALSLCVGVDLLMAAWIQSGAPLGKNPSTFFQELAYLISASILVLLVAILYPERARSVVPWFFLVLAWHTGFQISFSNVEPTTLSLIDVLIPLVLFMGSIAHWNEPTMKPVTSRLRRLLLYFGIACLWGVCLGLIRGTSEAAFLMNLKAFTLYPLILVVMVWCITSWRQLYASLGLFLVLVLERAAYGFIHHGTSGTKSLLDTGQVVNRANGAFASVNQYAFYIMSGLLIMLGLVLLARSNRLRLVLAGPILISVLALLVTYSRGALVGTAAGIAVLALLLGFKKIAGLVVLLALIFVVIQYSQPGATSLVTARFQSTKTDQSITERQGYYNIGFDVVKHYPFGAGWGASFLVRSGQLQADPDPTDWPWYHNDYLQLATQVGIPGLILFLWIWWFVFRRGYEAFRRLKRQPQAGLVAGLIASLAGMMVQASTDQFFWRTDIGPHIWLIAGLLLAAVHLVDRERSRDQTVPAA